MRPSADQMAREQIPQAHRAYLDATDEGDTEPLDDMLDDGFTLTHMTGHVQPKAEWLAQMREGQFVHHTIDEKNLTLDIKGDTATSSSGQPRTRRCTAPARTGGCN